MMSSTAWMLAVLLCVTQCSASLEVPPVDPHKQSMAACVLRISDEYFLKADTVALVFPDTPQPLTLDEHLVSSMYQCSAWSIFNKASTTQPTQSFANQVEVIHNYIIHTPRPADLNNTLRFLQLSLWNPHAKFVIFTTTHLENPLDEVAAIARTLWSSRVLNAVVLVPQAGDTLDIYTWFPFADGDCGGNFSRSAVINKCRLGELLDTAPLFPEKIPDNLHGCPVTVRTVVWPPFVIAPAHVDLTAEHVHFTEGTEIKLMNTIAEYTNMTVHYRVSQKKEDFGDMLANGTATEGLLKELVEKNVDIGIAALAATMKRNTFLDYTVPYATESITWCVPTADRETQWLSIIKILHVNTWFATMAAFLIIVLVIWTMSVHSRSESTTFQYFGSCSLYMFCTTLGITLRTLPRDTSVRIVYLVWVIYSLHVCVAFQTSLVSKLTDPSYEKQISTLDEIFTSRMSFGYLPSTIKYFEDNATELSQKILRHGVTCDDAEVCLGRIAVQRDFALALPRMYLVHVSEKYADTSGKSLIYWFKANTVSYPVQMFVYKGFPLLRKLNKLISRIKAGGFVDKWFEEAMMRYSVSQALLAPAADDDDEADALTFHHMEAAFTILAIGLSLGTVTFIGEQLAYHLHRHQERRLPWKFIM